MKASQASNIKSLFSRNLKPGTKTLLLRVLLLLLIFGFALVPLSSFLGKMLLEKYDMRWLGREITVDRVYVNPYTGYVHMDSIKIFEEKGDSLFISAESASAR